MVDDVERVATALYQHWAEECFPEELATWEKLGDKQTWIERAQAAIAALPAGPSESARIVAWDGLPA